MDVNWNEKILGLRIIDVRDFLIFIKFKGYYVNSIKELYKKIDCDWELFIKTLVKKNFINIVTNSENNKIKTIGAGGLSGKPLTQKSTEIIQYIASKSQHQIPIIAVGGIMTAQDAIDKLKAGASLVQLYTGFIYKGPHLVKEINLRLLKES